jgi:hypothetical protein
MVALWFALEDVLVANSCVASKVDSPARDTGVRRGQRPKAGKYRRIITFRQFGNSEPLSRRRRGIYEVPIQISCYSVEGQGVAGDRLCDELAECVINLLTSPDPACSFNVLMKGDPCISAADYGLIVYEVRFDGQQGPLRFDNVAQGWVEDLRFTFVASTCSHDTASTILPRLNC